MDFATLLHFAQTFGLIYFLMIFAGVLVYALRPKAKAKFDRCARIPLSED
jgi:cytochrome c oxidase cbb3-type subunit IV